VIHRPALLIADEPTGNLDSDTGRRVLEVLRTLHRDTGVALLLATHDPLIAEAADRVLTMRDGSEVSGPS
jgi:ABC-type lipoprotein export system ATPase subunit